MSRTLKLGLATAWTVGILVMVTVPPPDVPRGPTFPIDKLAHFGAFFLFAWLWMAAGTTRRTWIWVLVTGLIYAGGTEFVQEVVPVDRTPDPWDALTNVIGLLSGIVLHVLWTRLRSAVCSPPGS